MIDVHLIEKFLRGECRNEEAEQVSNYLRQHPDVVEELLPEEEWNKYLTAEPTEEFGEEAYNQLWNIAKREERKRRVYTYVISVAAAALIFFGIRYLAQPAPTETLLSKSEMVQKNGTDKDQTIGLSDNSIVTLSPGSEIKYTSEFNRSDRRIELTGTAVFSVAKNAQNQFTVVCGNIVTTALGTKFSVDGNAKAISVVLYEGKVVVKKLLDDANAKYLSPGDRLSFNIPKNIFELYREAGLASNTTASRTAPVNNAAGNKQLPAEKEIVQTPAVRTVDNDGHINFQNQNLKTVLSELAQRYDVEIDYPTEISTSINVFISIDTTQSIDRILQNIAALNNLGVKKVADKKFYLSK